MGVRSWAAALGAVAMTAAATVAIVPGAQAAADASVTIVHGIPNTPVDVYANGKKILNDFTFKSVAGPLKLPGGSYALAVRKAGSASTSKPILSATETVPSGANVSVVADLTASGSPNLVAFVNNTAAVGSGSGRIVVRHTAAAPAVDVFANGKKVISGLTNGQEQALTVPAGTVAAKVTLAGKTSPVIGPVNVSVNAGMGTVVYAVGSATGGTLTAVTSTFPLGGMPSGVQAGSGGQAGTVAVLPYVLVGLAGAALVVAGGRRLTRR